VITALVPEVSVEELPAAVSGPVPVVVRRHPVVVDAAAACTLETIARSLGDTLLDVEHKLRWRKDRARIPANAYLSSLDQTEYYWRHIATSKTTVQLPELPVPAHRRSDVRLFDNLWIGPAGSIQTFHCDNHDDIVVNNNLLIQMVGKKYVAVAPPADSAVFLSRPLMPGSTRHSSATPFSSEVQSACQGLQHCILGPGDVVFIPARYWHYVQSCTTSFSVSRWWFDHRLVELVYLATTSTLDAQSFRPLPEGTWHADVAALGGNPKLNAMLGHLPPSSRLVLRSALVRLYDVDLSTSD
jgi:hypothetical protein